MFRDGLSKKTNLLLPGAGLLVLIGIVISIVLHPQIAGKNPPIAKNLVPREVVSDFCRSWKNKDYQKANQYLSESFAGKETLKTAELIDFSLITQNKKIDSSRVTARVKLKFKRENPPKSVSGTNEFTLTKKKHHWQVDSIKPLYPLPPGITQKSRSINLEKGQ